MTEFFKSAEALVEARLNAIKDPRERALTGAFISIMSMVAAAETARAEIPHKLAALMVSEFLKQLGAVYHDDPAFLPAIKCAIQLVERITDMAVAEADSLHTEDRIAKGEASDTAAEILRRAAAH